MESDRRKCKICLEEKLRIQIGRYPNGKDKKFGDETGKQWNGSICPPCNTIRSKTTMQKTRASRSTSEQENS
jgi:hypothetical protein